MKNSHKTYIYMIRCEDSSIYTGIAKDLRRRLGQHYRQEKECAKYTKSHKMIKLETAFTAKDLSDAARLEYAIKRLPKSRKEELIRMPHLVNTIFAEKLTGCHYEPLSEEELCKCDVTREELPDGQRSVGQLEE